MSRAEMDDGQSSCIYCKQSIMSFDDKTKHEREGLFRCHKCPRMTFCHMDALEAHCSQKHGSDAKGRWAHACLQSNACIFDCVECGMGRFSKEEIDPHDLLAHARKTYRCLRPKRQPSSFHTEPLWSQSPESEATPKPDGSSKHQHRKSETWNEPLKPRATPKREHGRSLEPKAQTKPETTVKTQAQPKDLYAILGVTPESSHEDIEKAAKKRRIECHPDRLKRNGMANVELELIDERAKEVGGAAEVLLHPRRRARYDRKRR